jgi:hypothetical protein
MDVAFVKPMGDNNYPGGFPGMQRDLRYGDAVSLGQHWAYKYLVDLDGNSYSGRFMAFLASDSVPVKATVYREYYSDWIRPWYLLITMIFFWSEPFLCRLHYIPLSTAFKEIYNIHAFFSGVSQSTLEAANATTLYVPPSQRRALVGDRRLRRIARAGKQWKSQIGRPVDMEGEYSQVASVDIFVLMIFSCDSLCV